MTCCLGDGYLESRLLDVIKSIYGQTHNIALISYAMQVVLTSHPHSCTATRSSNSTSLSSLRQLAT